jgi:selenium metabolism protein YedF
MAVMPEGIPIPRSNPESILEPVSHPQARLAVLIASELLGHGPEELGRLLMRSFLKTWLDVAPAPWRMLFINTGVRLALDDSPVLDDLRALEEAGVELLACGTCLDYFRAKPRLRAGRVSNMLEIVNSLTSASRIVRP